MEIGMMNFMSGIIGHCTEGRISLLYVRNWLVSWTTYQRTHTYTKQTADVHLLTVVHIRSTAAASILVKIV